MLMEEENIFDGRQAALLEVSALSLELVVTTEQPYNLSKRGKKSIEDSSRHERIKARGASAPCCGGKCQDCGPEENWQSTKVCCKRNCNHPPGAHHEHITHLRVIDIVFAHMPHSDHSTLASPKIGDKVVSIQGLTSLEERV